MKTPVIGKDVFIAPGAVCIGDVKLGDESSVWFNATVRADRGSISIGQGSNIQDGCVVHQDPGYDVVIGKYVTIGHGAIIHGCQIGDGSLVGMGATILNGAVIGKNCVVGAGALVKQNMVVPDNTMVLGVPAEIKRMLSPEAIAKNRQNADEYVAEAKEYLKGGCC